LVPIAIADCLPADGAGDEAFCPSSTARDAGSGALGESHRAPTQVQYEVMRRLLNFIVSVGLIGAGLYVLYEELFVSYSGIHGRYQPFGVGLILIGSGVVWLWFYVVGDAVLKRFSGEE
jgi:hypothetical protein